ncbi:MAG: ABC transporter ATP-binding protein [Deltaproteobacteria bacterium RBG_13_53_10]|nr:MAG: ABC transporter ATP-binding protein [Deltaproteobacteria bacterium RBG_13_53_10]
MIKLEDVHKSFDGLEVLRGVSFEVPKGEILALIGISGHGKSVILKHVAGLVKPDRGRITIDGKEMGRLKGPEIEALRSRFGFLFQGGALFSSLTVFDNVAFPLKEKTKLSDQEIEGTVMTVLEQVGLRGTERRYPAQISGGMIKRTAIARALVRNPEIMLIDEPATGLDPVNAHTILDLIRSVHRQIGFTGIIVSHELTRVFQIVQRVAMLFEGVIITVGTPEEIMASQNPFVRQFITGEIEGPIQYR